MPTTFFSQVTAFLCSHYIFSHSAFHHSYFAQVESPQCHSLILLAAPHGGWNRVEHCLSFGQGSNLLTRRRSPSSPETVKPAHKIRAVQKLEVDCEQSRLGFIFEEWHVSPIFKGCQILHEDCPDDDDKGRSMRKQRSLCSKYQVRPWNLTAVCHHVALLRLCSRPCTRVYRCYRLKLPDPPHHPPGLPFL